MKLQWKKRRRKGKTVWNRIGKGIHRLVVRISPRLGSILLFAMLGYMLFEFSCQPVYAASDMWTVAKDIIKDVYTKIAGISTVLAGLMSAVAVFGAKLSNNQHKVDNAWDWLKRIWIAWAIINGIGAFIAYIVPLFSGLATLEPGSTPPTTTP